ncbi:hypothetical protein MLD38_007274 [Melastoma candidum]|uniref:Uncharacterized protein n=1 Tax=Melastoma candidum TaxID=119954 RepID=A0ACB9RTL7_9MYRT|nr:hypothetical protein MLD38_007274 [Melastoma candidum]
MSSSFAVSLPFSTSFPHQIHKAGFPGAGAGVGSFSGVPFFVGMGGDRGRRLTSSSRETSSRVDSGNEEGIRILEQEGTLPGGSATASPLMTADGLHATINGLSKWVVSGMLCSVVLWKHDAEALWMVLGSVFNTILSVTLKRVINQERPVANLRSDPGMPSSHAQSISFVITFAIISIIEGVGFNKASLTISGILLVLGVYMSWLRVSQQLHTTDQVIIGGLVGTSSFLLWYLLWRSVISSAFNSFLIVRVLIFLGAPCFCAAFIVYIMRNWLDHER